MKVDPTELMSASDIGDLLGVVPSAVANWHSRGIGFPEPVGTVGRGRTRLWLRTEVLKWYLARHGDLLEQIERTRAQLATLEQINTRED